MKIEMKTRGRNGGETFAAGAVIEVSEKEGAALVGRGIAATVDMSDAEEAAKRAADEKKARKELLKRAKAVGLTPSEDVALDVLEKAVIDAEEAAKRNGGE